MKRITIITLCFLLVLTTLTGCTYFGHTDAIRISSPAQLAISRIETFGQTQSPTPERTTTDPSGVVTTPPLSSSNITSDDITPPPPATNSPHTTSPIMTVEHLILSLNTKKIHCFKRSGRAFLCADCRNS